VRLTESAVHAVTSSRDSQGSRVGRRVKRGEPGVGEVSPQPVGITVGQRRPAIHQQPRAQPGRGLGDLLQEPRRS
jgi:hypothetical protein